VLARVRKVEEDEFPDEPLDDDPEPDAPDPEAPEADLDPPEPDPDDALPDDPLFDDEFPPPFTVWPTVPVSAVTVPENGAVRVVSDSTFWSCERADSA
jgi:hypothetical protein